jgi:hypothetical protein
MPLAVPTACSPASCQRSCACNGLALESRADRKGLCGLAPTDAGGVHCGVHCRSLLLRKLAQGVLICDGYVQGPRRPLRQPRPRLPPQQPPQPHAQPQPGPVPELPPRLAGVPLDAEKQWRQQAAFSTLATNGQLRCSSCIGWCADHQQRLFDWAAISQLLAVPPWPFASASSAGDALHRSQSLGSLQKLYVRLTLSKACISHYGIHLSLCAMV